MMSPHRGGVFHVLATLCRMGVGRQGDGRQYVSWIHEHDFVAALRFLIARDDLAGAFNLAAPQPLPNRDFMAGLHAALGRRLSIPIPTWALEIGAFFMRTETELILKSRRVVPGRLLKNGFVFRHPDWPGAAAELTKRWRAS
jgi:NAD dependent epimerase/dehydratase family enzyme